MQFKFSQMFTTTSKIIKKPKKVITKKPKVVKILSDITNKYQNKQNKIKLEKKVLQRIKSQNARMITKKRIFKEDYYADCEVIKERKTKNYKIVSLKSKRLKKGMKFYCFDDTEMRVSQSFQRIISHTCDNDVSTDDEQIKGAVMSLYKHLKRSTLEIN